MSGFSRWSSFWLVVLCAYAGQLCAAEKANYFDDSFLQVTNGIAGCPVPPGAEISQSEMRAQAHVRPSAERAVTCPAVVDCRMRTTMTWRLSRG